MHGPGGNVDVQVEDEDCRRNIELRPPGVETGERRPDE